MRRNVPTAVTVIAILHLVGGGLGLILSLCGCGGYLMQGAFSAITMPTPPTRPGQPPPPAPPNPGQMMKEIESAIPGYKVFTIASLGVSLVLDILLLSAGIGLLKLQSWARILSFIYAPISILYHIGSAVFQLGFVTPAMQAIYAKNPALAGMSSFTGVLSGIGVFFGLVFILYPIVVLVVLLRPSIAASFRTGLTPSESEAFEEEDRSDDDSWPDRPNDDRIRR